MKHYPMMPFPPHLHAMQHAALPVMNAQEFLKGFVMTACLASLDPAPAAGKKAKGRRVLRRALQGGAALGAADVAARASVRGDYVRALSAVTAGVASVYVVEQLLKDAVDTTPVKENDNG